MAEVSAGQVSVDFGASPSTLLGGDYESCLALPEQLT